jgi:hypothetical protein
MQFWDICALSNNRVSIVSPTRIKLNPKVCIAFLNIISTSVASHHIVTCFFY